MKPANPRPLRSVALPTEHGGWGFTLEPVLLGLLVAPGLAGVGLAVAAVGIFLARRPLRLLVEDRRHQRHLPRTIMAARVLVVILAAAAAGVAAAVLWREGPFWWALLAGVPLAPVQVWADLHRRGRWLPAELSGALAMGAAAPAIALAHGWEAAPAFGLWAVLAARDVPSILLVRAQLRRARGEPARPRAIHAAHALAILGLAALAAGGTLPAAAPIALALLWAWTGLSLARPPVPAPTLGWTQVLAGLLLVAITAAGHHFGL